MFVYNNQTFWLGTDQGLFRFSPDQNVRLERLLDKDQTGISQNISFIINESYNNIWIGADGLYQYDIIENSLTHHMHDPNAGYSLSNNFVTCGLEDSQGNLWFGTYASGMNVLMNTSNDFHKNSRINQQLDLLSRNITTITRDKNKNLWLGTWDKGVLVFDENQELQKDMDDTFPLLKSLTKERIRVVTSGPDESIWIGSTSGLLTHVDLKGQQNHVYTLTIPDGEVRESLTITSLLFQSDSLLWVGTNIRGLNLFDLRTKSFLPFPEQKQLSGFNILDLERDGKGNMWIATHLDGMWRMDINGNIRPYNFEEIADQRVRGANFITIFKDSRENLWFGTEFHGLIKLTPDDLTTIYTISEDLKNHEITSIEEDHVHKLWLATTQGLLRFEETPVNYRDDFWRYGLVADEFNYNSSFQGDDNTIYLGGTNGLAYFNPDQFRDNSVVPPVYIESFFIGNIKVSVRDPESPLSRPINLTDKITLKYSQNEIGFEFVSLNYISSGKNQYKYMLEGIDNSGWNELGSRRRITFTNLDWGNYTLRVKGSNNDGIWNEEGDSLDIRILPPSYLSWWAFVIYGIALIVVVYLVYNLFRQRIKMKQQLSMQQFEKAQQMKLSNMKLQLFTNISHEFKIPLSLIISPLEEIIQNFKGSNETRQKLRIIQQNSNRLLQMIKILIDFRKAEQDVLDLKTGRFDIIELARDTVLSFQSHVIRENKHIELKTSLSACVFEFDRDKIERVLYNLVDNAVNFTEELSEITLRISKGPDEGTVSIEVADTGVGIEEKDLERIFEKFHQVEQSSQMSVSSTGSGIGLYICRKIVELHHGSISVDSSPGKGSVFTILLPAADMQGIEGQVDMIDDMKIASGQEMLEVLEDTAAPDLPEDVPLVLIVEDHHELRTHIKKLLWNFYRVEEAENGLAGLKKAKSEVPDLVLSDIIMPEMDGVEMCLQIKKDPKTEHIPVILLSAKSDLESKLDGYEKGADEYLEKPFHPQHLLARIRNLIESREKLRAHFGDGIPQKPRIAGIKPFDREFLERVYYKTEMNTGNSEYNVTELSAELGMSRVHLYRRFKDLTGNTPKDYMKEVRLKAAAVLLEENRLTISEVAYQVGFNTPSNFTASFKSFYGISPKEYKSS